MDRGKGKIALLIFSFGLIVTMMIMGLRSQEEGTVSGAARMTPLEQAFYATGAELQDVSVSAWTMLDQKGQTAEDLAEIALRTAELLVGADTFVDFHTIQGPYETSFQAKAHTASKNVDVKIQVVAQGDTGRDIFFIVFAEEKGSKVDVKGLENLVGGIMQEKSSSFSISTCLSGWVSGKLEEEKMTQAIRHAFQIVRAKMEEGITGPHFVSYAGATGLIDRSITVGKKNINLNIAMRHHSTEDRTYVTAASPVITCEY